MSEPIEKETTAEIVTKEPNSPINPPKIKDPKKVEAGKKLAAYNKRAKNKKNELKENPSVIEENSLGGFNISLTTVVAIIGLGLTGIDLYLRHKKYNQKGDDEFKMIMDENKKNMDENEEIPVSKFKKKVRFESGME